MGPQRVADGRSSFLWCWEEGVKQRPSYRGVRSSYLVSDIRELALHYPLAMAAILESSKDE